MAVSLVSNEYSAKRSCQMSNRHQKQTSRFANTGLGQVSITVRRLLEYEQRAASKMMMLFYFLHYIV